MKDFFISYNRHDKQWAEWIAWTLEEAGFTVVIQAWDFRPGGNFALDMNKAVTETQTTIAVLSKTFLQSDYTAPEWAAAFARDPKSLGRRLIPVRVGECQPGGLLAQIVYVDLVGVAEPKVAKALVLGALQARAKPAQEPGFPGAVTPKAERTEPEPVAFPVTQAVVPTTTSESQLTLDTFKFGVVKVNAQGQETSRQRGQAQYFTEDLGYDVGLAMVSIPGGAFLMGAPETEKGTKERERPQHLVRLKPFFMSKYVVTQEQWFTVSELSKVNHDLDPNCSHFKGLKRPVEQVSWFEAVEFCDRLSRQTGREYRLPSEAEWEYACRAGTTTPFHFGETLTTDLANYSFSRKQTTDVGSFSANAFGLHDMHGNVLEWCADHWHDHYQGAPTDGSAWVTKNQEAFRLLRGGSWNYFPGKCRSAVRNYNPRDLRHNYIGFRVCCVPPRSLLSP